MKGAHWNSQELLKMEERKVKVEEALAVSVKGR